MTATCQHLGIDPQTLPPGNNNLDEVSPRMRFGLQHPMPPLTPSYSAHRSSRPLKVESLIPTTMPTQRLLKPMKIHTRLAPHIPVPIQTTQQNRPTPRSNQNQNSPMSNCPRAAYQATKKRPERHSREANPQGRVGNRRSSWILFRSHR